MTTELADAIQRTKEAKAALVSSWADVILALHESGYTGSFAVHTNQGRPVTVEIPQPAIRVRLT